MSSPGRYTKRCACDLVEAARLAQELEQARLAIRDHGAEAVEPRQEGVALVEHADVVERGVVARAQLAHARQRALEVVEVDDQASP